MIQNAPERSLEAAGDRVRDAASNAAERGLPQLQPLLDFQLLSVSGVTVTVGGLLAAIVILALALTVSRLARRMLTRYGANNPKVNSASLYTISRVVHYVLLVLGILLALDMAGIPIGKFTLFAGALGVGLGFGLQAIFSNFISGLILLFDRSLKIGDFVQLDQDVRGVVRAINIRSTRITTNDNIDVLVPNSEFINGRVTNWTHHSVNRRIRVPFSVAYHVDKELVKKAALEAAAQVPFTLALDGEKAPQVWLVNFGHDAVEFILAVWLTEAAARRNVAVRAAYLWELDTALKKYGIEIPYPQRDLNLRSLFGLQGEHALAALQGREIATPDTPEPVEIELTQAERAQLSRNDAREDAEREIVQEQIETETHHTLLSDAVQASPPPTQEKR